MRHSLAIALVLFLLVAATVATPASAQDLAHDMDADAARHALIAGDLPARIDAAYVLGADLSDDATAALIQASTDPSAEVRLLAFAFLGPRAVDADIFQAGLDDPTLLVRMAAAAAAARVDAPSRATLMLAAIQSDEPALSHAAVSALMDAPRTLWPGCVDIRPTWRAASLERPRAIETEALASLLESVILSASECGINADEVALLHEQAARYARTLQAPEMQLGQRRMHGRIDALIARMRALDAAATPIQRAACIDYLRGQNGDLYVVAEEATVAADQALRSAPESSATLEATERITTLTSGVDELEICFAEPRRHGLDAAPASIFWAQIGSETYYDDHVLARRQDVDNLRVTDQVTQRLLVQAEWNSEPLQRGADVPVEEGAFGRVRTELSEELWLGESQLNGAAGWAEGYGHAAFGESVVYTVVEGGHDRGMLDRNGLRRLVAPAWWTRAQMGFALRTRVPSEYYDDVYDDEREIFAFALGVEAETYSSPAPPTFARQDTPPTLPADANVVNLVPLDFEGTDRVTPDVRAKLSLWHEWGTGLYVEGGYRAFLYPDGMPGWDNQGTVVIREGVGHAARIEPGIYATEDDNTVFGQLGVTFSDYPEPTPDRAWTVTGRLYGEVAQDARNEDGGYVFSDLARWVADGSGMTDANPITSLRSGFGFWDLGSHHTVEFDFAFQVALRQRDVYDDRDLSALTVGFTTGLYFMVEDFWSVGLSYSLVAERDTTRQEAYLESMGESDDRSLSRNIVMIGLYAPFGGTHVDFLDARDPTWGAGRMRHPVIPDGWWLP